MRTIPLMEVAVEAPPGPRAVVPPARLASMPYRAYKPHPFTREERDSVTLLIGGLHWRAERIAQASMENLGYRVQVLPTATRDDLLTGREVADIGQCSPTSFTTGNLANFLRSKAKDIGAEEVSRKYVYMTFGACGACRFGQYHQSYELALQNVGLESFRMFLLAQGLDQDQARGDGLELTFPLLLGIAWARTVRKLERVQPAVELTRDSAPNLAGGAAGAARGRAARCDRLLSRRESVLKAQLGNRRLRLDDDQRAGRPLGSGGDARARGEALADHAAQVR